MVVCRDCVGGQTTSFIRVLPRMLHGHFELHGSFICKSRQPCIVSPVHLEWKIIVFLLKSLNSYCGFGNRIAYDWLGDQLLGLWSPFCLVVLISHQTDESFLPSKEQSVFVNWAAGVLIGSSVWLHRSVSCSLYFLDMLPWRWKLTLMPNRKTWCFIRSTSRSMTMSGKNSSLSPSHGGRGTLPVLGPEHPGTKMSVRHNPK